MAKMKITIDEKRFADGVWYVRATASDKVGTRSGGFEVEAVEDVTDDDLRIEIARRYGADLDA